MSFACSRPAGSVVWRLLFVRCSCAKGSGDALESTRRVVPSWNSRQKVAPSCARDEKHDSAGWSFFSKPHVFFVTVLSDQHALKDQVISASRLVPMSDGLTQKSRASVGVSLSYTPLSQMRSLAFSSVGPPEVLTPLSGTAKGPIIYTTSRQ